MDDLCPDMSNGYEPLAREFMLRRDPAIGVATVRHWARQLPSGSAVLDLGCGPGVPISRVLIEGGFELYGVDASPTMVAAFRDRFPSAPVACEPVEQSRFFGRTFDAVLAWGLLFLLAEAAQVALIRQVASVLAPGGRFLFTAPQQACTWIDVMTGRESVSLGRETYVASLAASGFTLEAEHQDEGGNHYYDARQG